MTERGILVPEKRMKTYGYELEEELSA